MLQSLDQASALQERCKSSTSVNELSTAVDSVQDLVMMIENEIHEAKKILDEKKHYLDGLKIEKKKGEAIRDSLKRMLSNLKSAAFSQRL